MEDYSLREIRPDIRFDYRKQSIAIEVQLSTLTLNDIRRRTMAYTQRQISVLWTSPWNEELEEERYAPRDWERYLHTLYYGYLFYWVERLELQPVTFETYLLAPSRYGWQKRSKRYISPALLPPCSILDLSVLWRNEWRAFPRAKLWSRRFPRTS